MKRKRYFAKWLAVILLMAIGIGVFGALYLSSEKEKEATEASPSSYLTNQRQHDIDMKDLKLLIGDFQAVESGAPGDAKYVAGWWHLFITDEYQEKGPYLSLNDNGSGNPGFEGRIMYLKDGILIVEIDQDLYEGMPSDWQPEGEGKFAILDYSATDSGVRLGYRGSEAQFTRSE